MTYKRPDRALSERSRGPLDLQEGAMNRVAPPLATPLQQPVYVVLYDMCLSAFLLKLRSFYIILLVDCY